MKIRTIAISLVTIFLWLGCASHKYTVIEPPSGSLKDFEVLEIPQFSSNLKDPVAQELACHFADRLIREIDAYRRRHDDVIYHQILTQTDQQNDVLLMKGKVISYDEGSRAKRYFLGMGSGKAYCTIQVRFIDKATGAELARTNFDSELARGRFGGSADEAVDGMVTAFLDYMKQYMDEA